MDITYIKKTTLLIFTLLLLGAFIFPQKDISDRVRKTLETYRVNFGPEKVYIHHDKPYYMAGELVWMKAYVRDASDLRASDRSGVLYVDLLNSENEAVERMTFPVSDGEASGDFLLPDDLQEGVYKLTAYTRWMRNFGEETFFQKEIIVLEAGERMRDREVDATPGEVDLQFFPEGGDLVSGVENEVAFKAVASNGRGLPLSASLFDREGQKIRDFESRHAGMGSFTFTPESGQEYYAKVNFGDGRTVDYPLPAPLTEGYALHVDEISDVENIRVRIATATAEPMPLKLFSIANDKLVHVENIPVDNLPYQFTIPKSEFPTGIARLTLTEERGEPLAERLVFIRHRETVGLEVESGQKTYAPREEVRLSLGLNGQENAAANVSVSVTAEALVRQPEYQDNIQTYLLLTSDLKGRIASPGYYFENEDQDRQEALRDLMMTQGWRRFDWDAMVAGKFPKIRYRNEFDLNIRGKLLRANGEPVPNGQALLYLRDRFQTFITTTTDEEGNFAFRGFYYSGTIPVVIQGSDRRGRREDVEVHVEEREFSPGLYNHRIALPVGFEAQLPEDYVISTHQQFRRLETEVGAMDLGELLLEEVIVEGRAEIQEPFRLHTRADAILYREQLPVAPSGNILETLQGRVAGLQVTPVGMNEFRAVIRGLGTPLYLLDGMPIPEQTVSMINQFDISRIEVLKTPGAAAIYGGRGGGGVIALYTDQYYEEEVDLESGKYIIIHEAEGFTRTRQFYSPAYEDGDVDYYDLPDLRSTVYWNPMVVLRNNEQKQVSFFTADTPGTYRAIIEGITESGKPIRKEVTFEVE